MSLRSLSLLSTATALLAAAAVSQVPPGSGIACTRFQTATGVAAPANPAALQLVDPRAGSATVVSGLAPTWSNPASGAFDPVTGDVVLGGYHSDARLSVHVLGPSGVQSSRQLAAVLCRAKQWGCAGGLPIALNAIDLDHNGDYLVCNNVEIWQVDRAAATLTLWDTIAPRSRVGESFNGLAIDREGNRMWVVSYNGVVFGPGYGEAGLFEYDLTQGPGPGRLLLDLATRAPQLSPHMTGIAYDGRSYLYVSALTYNGSPSLMVYDLATGLAAPVAGAPTWHVQDVAVDRLRGLVHVVGAGGYATLDVASGAWTQTLPAPGTAEPQPVQVAVNDLLDRTEVFPRAPSVSSRFVLEAAAHALPGEVAGLFLVAVDRVPLPAAIQLAVGVADAGGFVRARVPVNPSGLAAGVSFTVAGVRVARASGRLTPGTTVDVVLHP